MRQYCSVCKAQFDMTVVSEAGDDGVVWLKCPQCAGILPHMPAEDASPEAAEAAEAADGAAASGPVVVEEEELDLESARAYSPKETYEVGDVVHHRAWNDYGTVVAKEVLPGNRHMIRVRFTDNGEVQLLASGGD